MSLLEVTDLSVSFATEAGRIRALNGVSFRVERGGVLAVLGESGSGKSVTAAAIMDLIPTPPGSIDGGSVTFDQIDLLRLPRTRRRDLCGERISLIFQDALAALNPVYPVGWQIAELFRIHGRASAAEARGNAVALMRAVGIPDPVNRARHYPHEFSGGMRQRVAIAMAVALSPDLIIADEPTTALDVTVQAQIIELLREVLARSGAAMIFITHDLGVAAELADAVAVMYAGRIVETGSVFEVLASPLHPYTQGLLASQPRGDSGTGELVAIAGSAPDPAALPSGCAFHPRCPLAADICRSVVPELRRAASGHEVACHMADLTG